MPEIGDTVIFILWPEYPERATPQDIVYAGVIYEILANGQVNFHVLEKKNEELSDAYRDGYIYHPDPKEFNEMLGRLWKKSASMPDKVRVYDQLIKDVREELERLAQAEDGIATVPAAPAALVLEDDDLASDVDDAAKLNKPQTADARCSPCFAVVPFVETSEQQKAKRKLERAKRTRAGKEYQKKEKEEPADKLRCNLFQVQQLYKVVFGSAYSRGQDLPSQEEVKKAYKVRSLIVHPDKGGDPAVFKQLKEDYPKLMQLVAGGGGIRRYTHTEMMLAKIWLGFVNTDDHVLIARQVTEAYEASMRTLAGDPNPTEFARRVKTSRLALARDVLLDIATTDVWRVAIVPFELEKHFPGAFPIFEASK